MSPDGPVVLVTGAGSGIGRALALEAAARGMRVVLVGRRESALKRTRDMAGSGAVDVVAADVTAEAGRERIRVFIKSTYGRLDLLINNAGKVVTGALEHISDGQVERMMALNVVAPITLSRELLELLRASPAPRIVNVGSMFGDIAFPYFAAYSASKFALRGLSDALRRELSGDGIGVTYAAPRATRTPAAAIFVDLVEPMSMRLDSPGAVARQILDAARKGRRNVYPRGPERLFVLAQRLFPGLIDRNLSALAKTPAVRAAVAEMTAMPECTKV